MLEEVDRDLVRVEADATPDSFERHSQDIERITSASSVWTSSSREDTAQRIGVARRMSRVPTQRDLERHPTELSRIQTHRSQHSATVGRSVRSRPSKRPLPEFGAGKPYPPLLPAQEEYVVEFAGPDDPLHPQNWPLKKKVLLAAMLGYTTMIVAFGSSIFSTTTGSIAAQYHVSTEVGILGVSLYVLGFATGPSLWAPLSELKGRKLPLVLSVFAFSIFSVATATAKDLQTIMITRFFGGFFGASPLSVVAAVFSDIFDNRTRGIAITAFAMTVFSGPLLAPFVGGFIVDSYLGWRWTEYLVAIMGFSAFLLDLFFLDESYPPVVLISKASELRRRTHNWGVHAKQEEIMIGFKELVTKNFTRPLRLLCFEPIVLLISIYMSFVYGILYLMLTAYPLIFHGIHGFNAGLSGLAFFGMIIGEIFAGVAVLAMQPRYSRKLAANNGIPVPEWRLPPVIAGGIAFAGGIFWLGWSGYRADMHWITPTLSGLLTGFGLMSIFLQCLNYLIDTYLMFAASAIAGNTFMRSLCGAGFPLFSTYMFNGMGIQWACMMLGCIAVLLIPIPVLFWLYGHKIRAKSTFAPTPEFGTRPSAEQPVQTGSASEGEKETGPVPDHALLSVVSRKDGGDFNGV